MSVARFTRAALMLTAALLLCRCFAANAEYASANAAAAPPQVILLTLHNTLQPVSQEILQRNLDDANRTHPAAILIDLSSPGGLPSSAGAMARAIHASAAPVIVYVGAPRAEIAGEALALLNAGAVSAMHPDSVLRLSRKSTLWHWRSSGALPPTPEMLAAIQQERLNHGAAAVLPDGFLRTGQPMSAAQALQSGLVDAIASTPERLVSSLEGKQTVLHGQPFPFDLRNFALKPMPLSQREHLLRAVMNPDLTVLLLTLGSLLIYLEVNTPGSVVPGAAGLLLVMLALFALHHMPLRTSGVLLLGLSVLMLFAEAVSRKGSAFGVLSVLALIFGLRLLVRGPIPELEVDWSTAIGAGIGFGGITAGLLLLGVRAKRAKIKIGGDALIGWLGVSQTALDPAGQVLVRGELWNARLSSAFAFLPAGECVTVQQFEGSVLQVAPLPTSAQS